MNWTNKHGLPEYLVKWLQTDEYDHIDGTFSATGLLKPARAVVLSRLHKDEIVLDVSDVVASRYGSALHDSFAKLNLGEVQEHRFEAELDGFRIVGKPDLIIAGKIIDFKSTSVWKYIYKDYLDFIQQESIYRWLAEENGMEIDGTGEICFLFTDWAGSKAKFDPDYPQSRCAVESIPLMNEEKVLAFMRSRLLAFMEADINLPECTREELWQKPDKFAVKKIGAKKATKLYDDLEEAENALQDGQEIEQRKGLAKRCGYCNASPFCQQRAEMAKEGLLG